MFEELGEILGNIFGNFEGANVKFTNGGVNYTPEDGLNINIKPNSETLRLKGKPVYPEIIEIGKYEKAEEIDE